MHPADRQRRFGTQVVSKSSVSWSTRGSPGMHPQHASRVIRFLRGGVEVGMEHMPKPDRHESIMTAALGRPARRPRASILTGRLPMHPAHCASTAGGLDSRPSYRRLTQPERCKARPTSRTPSAQAGDPLGPGVNYPKLDEPGGHRRTNTHPERWVSLRRARQKTYDFPLSETSVAAPLEKNIFWY